MNYDNEAIVRNAYHTAEGNVLDIPGWIDSFTKDGVFNNVTGEESYRGEHLRDVVIAFGQMFPDVHRELHRQDREIRLLPRAQHHAQANGRAA